MKKILLVTLQSTNIGNRLQNYALQQTLVKMGCSVFTPYYLKLGISGMIKCLIAAFLGIMGVNRYHMISKILKREHEFKKFDKKYIANRFLLSYRKAFRRDWSRYDYAVTGSDQVWHNWSKTHDELNFFYLNFIPEEKRISYAPSFGFSEFPEEDVEIHKKGIDGIHALSCREIHGKELINKLTGRSAAVVADPTLLLHADEWRAIERKPAHFTDGKYLLVYFLGNKPPQYQNAIKQLAKDNDLNIICILNNDSPEYYFTTPDEFLWLADHAEYICTDSFHACVFSIIFHKRFMAFKRREHGLEDMFDRIESLFAAFNLNDKVFESDISKIERNIDYQAVDEKKKTIIDESVAYLSNVLDGRETS